MYRKRSDEEISTLKLLDTLEDKLPAWLKGCCKGWIRDIIAKLAIFLLKPKVFWSTVIILIGLDLYLIGITVRKWSNQIWTDLSVRVICLICAILITIVLYKALSFKYKRYNPDSLFKKVQKKIELSDSLIILLKSTDQETCRREMTTNINFDATHVYEIPTPIEKQLKTGFGDYEKMLVEILGGKENRPLIRLNSLGIDLNKCEITLNLGYASYSDMWIIHYLADYALSRRVSRETHKIGSEDHEYVTIRNTLEPYLRWYYNLSLRGTETRNLNGLNSLFTNGTLRLNLAPVLPNGLGITGIVQFQKNKQKFVLLQKRRTSQVDPGRIQWSFAGLIGAFDDLFELKNQDEKQNLNLTSLFWSEFVDEAWIPIFETPPSSEELRPTLLGLVLNAEMLYQPELILTVTVNLSNKEWQLLLEKKKSRTVSFADHPIELIKLLIEDKTATYILASKETLYSKEFENLLKQERENGYRRFRLIFDIAHKLLLHLN